MFGEEICEVNKIEIEDFKNLCDQLYTRIKEKGYTTIYGVPRGGTLVAQYLCLKYYFTLSDKPEEGCLIVDDLIDSGKTREKYKDYDFEALIKKENNEWIQFFIC